MWKIGCTITARDKVLKDLNKSAMNMDAISKGAVVNLFTSLPWLEKFKKITDPESTEKSLRKSIFTGDNKTVEDLVLSTCLGGSTISPWTKLLHKKNREDYRKKVTEKRIAICNSQSTVEAVEKPAENS